MTRQFHQVAAREAARLPLRDGDPGRVGRYWLIARLGSGGMGAVYLGVDRDGREACPAGSRVELRMCGPGV